MCLTMQFFPFAWTHIDDLHDILARERLLSSKWGWKLTPTLVTNDWSETIVVDRGIEVINDVEEILQRGGTGL